MLLSLAVFFNQSLLSQPVNDSVRIYIDKLNSGKADEVKQQLPQLIAKYQNDPGILYLEGRLASDGVEATKLYQSLVDNYPRSEWADDALFHIYQYYYALGLYKTAELKRQQLRLEYPNSPFLGESIKQDLPGRDEVAVNFSVRETLATQPERPQPVRDSLVADAKSNPPKAEETGKRYALQVGAFSSSGNASKQKSFFEDAGYTVETTNKVRNGKSLYLVWVGSYRSEEEAKRAGRQIKAKYKIDSIVVERY